MCSASSSKDVRMCSRGDGAAGQAENPATSLYAGTHVWIFFEQPLPASKARRLGNTIFYARQGMRLSTYNIPRIISCANMEEDYVALPYNIPRIISCANMEEDYVALPRGCEDAVIALLESNQVAYQKTKPIMERI